MANFVQQPLVQLVLWGSVLAVLIAVGYYLIGRIRSLMRSTQSTSSDLMTDFREIYSQGELSDEEYRAIKGTLADRLQSEVRSAKPSADGRKSVSPGESLPSLRIESLKGAKMGANLPSADGVSDTRQ